MSKAGLTDCINAYAEKTGCTKVEADKVVRNVLEVIKEQIIEKGGLTIVDLFTFKIAGRKGRVSKAPLTGKIVQVPPYKTINLRIGKALKAELNK